MSSVQSLIKFVRVLVSYSLATDGNATGMYSYGLNFPRNATRKLCAAVPQTFRSPYNLSATMWMCHRYCIALTYGSGWGPCHFISGHRDIAFLPPHIIEQLAIVLAQKIILATS
eukprot:scaffold253995_cov16-Prasinocladus_malaysianus.AAC.1